MMIFIEYTICFAIINASFFCSLFSVAVEDDYLVLRRVAKENWDAMKNYLGAVSQIYKILDKSPYKSWKVLLVATARLRIQAMLPFRGKKTEEEKTSRIL